MTKFLMLFIGLTLISHSCTNATDFDIVSNISTEEFQEYNRNRNYSNVKTLDITELDFGIKYQTRGSGRNSTNCEIQIIRSGNHFIMRAIEMSRSKAFSKSFTHKVDERILTRQELALVFTKFKECEHLPINISIEDFCMHVPFFSIQIKSGNNLWATNWCSLTNYKYPTKYADYKTKIQELEGLLLQLADVTPSKKMLIIDKIRNNDSLRIQAFITYGLNSLDTKYEFDNVPIITDSDGVGEIIIHPRDTTNWKSRIDVYEIRKDKSIHLVDEEYIDGKRK